MPNQDNVQIIGRVINCSPEEARLNADNVSLFNIGEDSAQVTKFELRLVSVPTCSLFEGEVIVVEGIKAPNSRFNVNRVFKPSIAPERPLVDYSLVKRAETLMHGKGV